MFSDTRDAVGIKARNSGTAQSRQIRFAY